MPLLSLAALQCTASWDTLAEWKLPFPPPPASTGPGGNGGSSGNGSKGTTKGANKVSNLAWTRPERGVRPICRELTMAELLLRGGGFFFPLCFPGQTYPIFRLSSFLKEKAHG
jgi:hypothetical protein